MPVCTSSRIRRRLYSSQIFLTCCGKCSKCSAMKGVLRGDYFETIRADILFCILACKLYSCLIRLCARITEKYLVSEGMLNKEFCKSYLWPNVIEIRDMQEPL